MAIREIPKAFDYTCDVCGKTHRQENAGGHYTDSRPPHWANLIIRRDAHDFQGQAVADGSVHRLLCGNCGYEADKVLNEWAKRRKAADAARREEDHG